MQKAKRGPARKGGRPLAADGQMVVVTVRLPVGLVERIDAVISASGYKFRDRSELIRQTVAEAVRLMPSRSPTH
jgi:hypothetical protein